MYFRGLKMKTSMENATKTRPSMKANIKGFIVGLSVLAFLSACEAEKVKLYDPATDGIYFAKIGENENEMFEDTTRFAFGALPNPHVESAICTITAHLAGALADHDREFFVDIFKGPGNPATKCEVIQPSILKAGKNTADIEIRVWRTPNLDTRDTITVKLKSSPDLTAELDGMLTRCITLYNKVDKPSWWGDWEVQTRIGRFHEIKMEILNLVLGSIENPLNPAAEWTFRQAVLNKYCEDNDIKYPGTDEQVSFLGENYIKK